ncbi:MAG: F0F1 ATP synthase subunit B [Patescibacteria group bacterium]
MDALISTFHIDWKIIIAQAFNFAIVFVVLYIFALKPLQKLMAERSDKIAKGITDAKENAATLDKTKKEYEDVLAAARKEAQKIFEDGKKEAMTKKEAMMMEAKAEVASMIESGKKTLEVEKAKMVADAKKEVVGVVVAAAEKILSGKGGIDEKALKELSSLK